MNYLCLMKYYKYQSEIDGSVFTISKNIKRYISKTNSEISLRDKGLLECATDKDKSLLVQFILKGFVSVKKDSLLADELTVYSANKDVTWTFRIIHGPYS